MPDRVPVRVLERGRVTIPVDVREELGLERGDRLWLTVEPIDEDRADVLYSHADSAKGLHRD